MKSTIQRIPPQSVSVDEGVLQAQLDRLESEFEHLRTQVRKAQRLATLGTGAATLAHEFNNLLTPIFGYVQTAVESNDPSFMKKALERTLKQAGIMTGMCDRILRLAADEPIDRKPVAVLAVTKDAVASLGRDLDKDNITLELQIDEELRVLADEHELLRVLLNLVINARQAMMGRPGRLTIDAAIDQQDTDTVVISVCDCGPGILPEVLPRIFEAGFTTKQNADRLELGGIGLGLAVSREIIEENGGTLTAESTPGHGATFRITLPIAN